MVPISLYPIQPKFWLDHHVLQYVHNFCTICNSIERSCYMTNSVVSFEKRMKNEAN